MVNGISGVLSTARANIQNQTNTIRNTLQSTRTQLLGSRQSGQASILSQFRGGAGGGNGLQILQAPGAAGGNGGILSGVMGQTGILGQVRSQGVLGFVRGKIAPGTPAAPTAPTVTPPPTPAVPGISATPHGFTIS